MEIRKTATRESVHQLFDAVDAISVQGYDEQRRVVYWNRGSEVIYGYTAAEALGRKLEDLIIPADMRGAVIAGHRDWLEQGVAIPASELVLRNKAGEDVNVFSNHVMFVDDNNQREMYCIDIDLAEVRRAQAETVLKEHMLRAVFEATPDLFFLMNADGVVIDYHAGDHTNLYVAPENLIGQRAMEFLPNKIARKFQTQMARAMEQSGHSSFEYELNLPADLAYFEARVSYLPTQAQFMVIVRDITEKQKAAKMIRQQAYFDALTSLPNRFLSLDRLSQMLKEMERDGEQAAVLFLDIDDFKKVNDSLGHEVGDKLLVEAARRLKRAVRKSDTVGRLGGDEFIVLLRALKDINDLVDIAEGLLGLFREPFRFDGRELVLTLSIGIAIYPDNGASASNLLRNADTAMYQAKALGRNAYSFFTKEMNDRILRRLEIEAQLHGALERNEFSVSYQPKFDVRTERMVGAEALLRWRNPILGQVSPAEFIPIAEHTGLIGPVGKFVIKQAIAFLGQWQAQHQRHYTMAVNLSPRQFRDKKLVEFIAQTLREQEIEPARLELEITEGVLMNGEAHIDKALADLNELGVLLAMDDFGTGYSSLSYLRRYAFDVLKVDRSFINGITLNKEDRDLVVATIAMAHSLGLLVVAEGVEERAQLALLDELGCDLAQGYYFSEPLPPDELVNFQHQSADRPQTE
ncbi:putative bifunctional diguanylate cyclase/phosphodiesterase [Marinobacter sp. X15-166B]|uniref:putative bifunctional diguanylate cyclase/phosphodiesterase n=1 Tax=Marinobacter sp. X15-166B TaxID=1897620 RepID=UPI00085BFEFF|nr:EAL domain-containing protein [Marinobacter sp. X15-166B]OEY68053.1 diguanylate phosphodiesterase [Marinobacter sp. X15-166B]